MNTQTPTLMKIAKKPWWLHANAAALRASFLHVQNQPQSIHFPSVQVPRPLQGTAVAPLPRVPGHIFSHFGPKKALRHSHFGIGVELLESIVHFLK